MAKSAGVDRLEALAEPHMLRLRDAARETVELAVGESDRVLVLHCVDSPQSIRLFARPGKSFPLHRLATGRVLLAGMDDGRIADLHRAGCLEEAEYRPQPGSLDDVMAMIATVRERGYETDRGIARGDVERIAAPVRDARGRTVASVGIAGPAFRLKPDADTIEAAIRTAEAI